MTCGGTSSIHTEHPSIDFAYFARKWAAEFPDLRVWLKETQLQETKNCLIEEIKWPKDEKESSSLLKAEITTSESPLTIKEGRLRSIARVIARTAARASTSSEHDGSLIFSANDASTWPWESWTITYSYI